VVRIDRVYTRVGDRGQTMLGDGSMVAKHGLRVEAYGAVDEANAAIGLARARVASDDRDGPAGELVALLGSIQNDLFDVGADLALPITPDEEPGRKLRVLPGQTLRLEQAIDRYNDALEPLTSFVLPGGTLSSAHMHVARTSVRRAERKVAALWNAEPRATNLDALVYLNRLGDLLFVLGRVLNDGGQADVLWVPGAER
jgi:cob(I)alamin adenosyltransferase